jgi:very-short-patch-repair endonuclease
MGAPPVTAALAELGGVARRAALVRACGRAEVDRALRSGELVVVGRSYATPGVDAARAVAASVSGVLSHRSAALQLGWAVRSVPRHPDVTLAKGRTLTAAQRSRLVLLRTDLGSDDVVGDRTSAERTLLDCLRSLPLDEAVAIADSALREGFSRERLMAIARDAAGPGARQVRAAALCADGRAANPFESSLRVLCRQVPGLDVEPQVPIRDPHWLGRPDLVDQRLRVAMEADSFAWHGDRAALDRDAHRYNALVAAGWLVLRFSWEEVMLRGDRVVDTLARVVRTRTEQCSGRCRAA